MYFGVIPSESSLNPIHTFPASSPHIPPHPTQGGPALFMQEMEALLRVARLSSWRFLPGDIANALWGLANARHWTDRLAELEECVVKVCERL